MSSSQLIKFSNDLDLELLTEQGQFLGIGQVRMLPLC